MTLPYCCRLECGHKITVCVECNTFGFTQGSWILDAEPLLAGGMTQAEIDTISLSVSDQSITFGWNGKTWNFFGFEASPSTLQGKFASSADWVANYDEEGNLLEVKRPEGYAGDGPKETYTFERVPSGPNEDEVAAVTLTKEVEGTARNISRLEYVYYSSSGDYGEVDDIWAKRVLVWDPNQGSGGGWVRREAYYTAYFPITGKLRFVLDERQYQGLLSDLGEGEELDFNQLDNDYPGFLDAIQARAGQEYTYVNEKSDTQKLEGGRRSYGFELSENPNWTAGPNHWKYYAKETLKNDQQQTVRVKEVYASASGQLLLSKIVADGITWWEYLEYGQDIDKGATAR